MVNFEKLMKKDKMEKNKMEKNKMVNETTTKIEIERTNTWMNLSKSGKGLTISVKDDFKIGEKLTLPVSAVTALIDGERNGVNVGRMIFTEE